MNEEQYQLQTVSPEDHDFVSALLEEVLREQIEQLWGWDEKKQEQRSDSLGIPTR